MFNAALVYFPPRLLISALSPLTSSYGAGLTAGIMYFHKRIVLLQRLLNLGMAVAILCSLSALFPDALLELCAGMCKEESKAVCTHTSGVFQIASVCTKHYA